MTTEQQAALDKAAMGLAEHFGTLLRSLLQLSMLAPDDARTIINGVRVTLDTIEASLPTTEGN